MTDALISPAAATQKSELDAAALAQALGGSLKGENRPVPGLGTPENAEPGAVAVAFDAKHLPEHAALAQPTSSMNPKHPFKWRHFQSDIIFLCVRWYLRYPLSYRHLEEMMMERGLTVNHSTVYRWVQAYAPELDKRCRSHLRPTNDSWRVDEILHQG